MVCPWSRSLFRFIINKVFYAFLTLWMLLWSHSSHGQAPLVLSNADGLEATLVAPWGDGALIGGTFRGTWEGGPALGANDAWLRHYDSTLQVQQTYWLRSPAAVQLTALATSPQGWYWAGSFSDSLLLGNGDTVLYAQRPTAILAHHRPDGRLDWVYPLPATGVVHLNALAVDASGQLAATGSFQDSLRLHGQPPLTTTARQAPLLLQLSPNGQLNWVQTAALCLDAQGTALAVDAIGDLYWTAHFNGQFAWAGLPDTFQAHWVYRDVLIQKISPQGQPIWHHHATGAYDNTCSQLTFYDGLLYAAGQFKGLLNWANWRFQNAYQQHYASYVLALNPQTGSALWGRQSRAIADNGVQGLALGEAGLALCGSFEDSLDWDGALHRARAGADAYRLLLDSSGQVLSTAIGRGPGFDLAQGLAWGAGDALWMVGTFQDSLVWADSLLITGTGFSSAYIWRWAPPLAGQIITPVQTQPFTLVNVWLQPNPAQDTVRIVLDASNTLQRWYLYDLRGQLVQHGREALIDVTRLPKGTYSLRIESNAGMGVEKLVVP